MPQENWWNYWYDPRTAIWLIFYEIKSPSCCYATAWGLSAFARLKWMRFRFYTWESGKGKEKLHLPHPLDRIALRWRSGMRIRRSAWLNGKVLCVRRKTEIPLCQPKWDSILNKNVEKIALQSFGTLDIWMHCATIWQKRWCSGGQSRKRRTFIPEASRRNRATASKLISGETAETRFFKAQQLVNFNKNLVYM